MQKFLKSKYGFSLLILCTAFVASGCYEGWEYYGNAGTGEEEPTVEPGIKPIYYILFQPILLNDAAMADTNCFPTQSLSEFKTNEWASRITKASAALAQIADIVVTNPIAIPPSDCDDLNFISLVATSDAPWGAAQEPEQDPLDRVTVQIKAPMWDSEPSATPSAFVVREQWSAWQELSNLGRRTASLHYFTLSNPVNGFFSEWRSSLQETVKLDATAINSVDPTQGGIESREATTNQDTEALIAWVLSKA